MNGMLDSEEWFLVVGVFLVFGVFLCFQWKGRRGIEGKEAVLARKCCPICASEYGPNAACKARFGPDHDENLTEELTGVWRVQCSKCGAEADFDKGEDRLQVRTGEQPDPIE